MVQKHSILHLLTSDLKEALEGTNDLFILKLKAKRAVKFDLKAIDGVLVDKNLNTRKF